MSRVGKKPIILPDKVKAAVTGSVVHIEGPKGKHDFQLPDKITVKVADNVLTVIRATEEKPVRSLHGTIRALIYNVIVGLTEGFKRELEIVGMGYKAQMKGKTLALNIGFSHPIELEIPEGLTAKVEGPNKIIVEGSDKQKLGQFAAHLRSLYPPEPYKGKGIRYSGEEVRKKLGKAMTK